MKGKPTQWCWASIFPLCELKAFNRVEFLGNCFQQDVASTLAKIVQDDVEWVPLPKPIKDRFFKNRKVEIGYFSDCRPASRSMFQTNAGQDMLREIGRYLATITKPEKLIWTANERHVKPALIDLDGIYLTPKQAGTNRYSKMTEAAAFYAAKSSPNVQSFLKLFGVDSEQWARSTEYEVIQQFVTRTSIREPDSDETVRFWVFDKFQAEFLKDHFDKLPYLITSICKEPLELAIPQRQRSGPKAVVRTPEEEKHYRDKKREANTLRIKLARQAKRAANKAEILSDAA